MSETKKETIAQKLANIRAEAKKVNWPTKDDLVKKTMTVIVVCALFSVIIFGIDSVYSAIYNLALDLVIK